MVLVGGLTTGSVLVLALPFAFLLTKPAKPPIKAKIGQDKQLKSVNQPQLLSAKDKYQLLLSKGRFYYSKARSQQSNINLLNQAIEAYRQAIDLKPNKPEAYFLAGQLYDSIRQSYPQAEKQAYQAYLNAHKKYLNQAIYLNTLANFLIETQQPAQAFEILNKDLKYTPANYAGRLILAQASIQIGKLNQAVVVLTYLKRKKALPNEVDKQLKVLKKLVELDPSFKNNLSAKDSATIDQKIEMFEMEDIPSQQASSNKLVIASPTQDQPQLNLIETTNSNGLTGKVVLKSNQVEAFVKNDNVKPDSKIIITTEEDINQSVYVKSKQVGGFSLAVSGQLDSQVTVVYWISN